MATTRENSITMTADTAVVFIAGLIKNGIVFKAFELQDGKGAVTGNIEINMKRALA